MFKRGRHRIVRLILVERFVDQFAQSRCNHFHLKGRTKVVGCPKLHNVHRILQGRGGAKNHDRNFRVFLCSTREDRCQGRRAWPLEHDHGNKRSPIERRQGFAFAGSHLDLETACDEIARQRRSDRQADDKTGFPFTPSAQLGHSRSMPNRHACCNSIYARCFLRQPSVFERLGALVGVSLLGLRGAFGRKPFFQPFAAPKATTA